MQTHFNALYEDMRRTELATAEQQLGAQQGSLKRDHVLLQTVTTLDSRVTVYHTEILDRVAALSTSLATTQPAAALPVPDPTPSILPKKRHAADDGDAHILPTDRNLDSDETRATSRPHHQPMFISSLQACSFHPFRPHSFPPANFSVVQTSSLTS